MREKAQKTHETQKEALELLNRNLQALSRSRSVGLLTEGQEGVVQRLLCQYTVVFSRDKLDLGHTSLVKNRIEAASTFQ